jgi:hypothetical protein
MALATTLPALQGCTPRYWTNRAADANDVLTVGFTYTPRPNFSLYLCAAGFATLGGGYVEGMFLGAGGDQVGVTYHYQRSLGLVLWSYEEFGWGTPDPVTGRYPIVDRRYVGLLGWLFGPNRKFSPA